MTDRDMDAITANLLGKIDQLEAMLRDASGQMTKEQLLVAGLAVLGMGDEMGLRSGATSLDRMFASLAMYGYSTLVAKLIEQRHPPFQREVDK